MPEPKRRVDAKKEKLDEKTIGRAHQELREEGGELAVFIGGTKHAPGATILVQGPLTEALLSVLERLGYKGALGLLASLQEPAGVEA